MRRALLLIAYGALCVVGFLVDWGKEKIAEHLKGPPSGKSAP